MTLRTVIADDEALARRRLRRLLAEHDVEIVAEAANGASAVRAVEAQRPDLLLLDIQMPGMDGFGVLRALDFQHMPTVIFVTGFDQHAIQAFEHHVLDYLLKPVTGARLAKALGRARDRRSLVPEALVRLLEELGAPRPHLRRLAIHENERTIFISADTIDWIEAAGNYAVVHIATKTHILRESLTSLEEQLPPDAFFRVSRFAIVNLRHVSELATNLSIVVLRSGQRVAVTCSLREIETRLRIL